MVKRLFLLFAFVTASFCQSTAYSYTVGDAQYSTTTDKPTFPISIQVIRLKVVTGVSAYLITPQGTNVSQNTQTINVSNLGTPSITGWFQYVLVIFPINSANPMTVTAPLISTAGVGSTATQVN